MIRVRGFPRVLVPIGRSRKAGPSAPLRNASLRMTNLGGVRAEKQKTTAGPLRLRSGQAFGFAQPPHGRRPVRGDPGATPRTKTCPRGPRRMTTNHGGVRAEKRRTTAGPRRFAFPCLKIETWATAACCSTERCSCGAQKGLLRYGVHEVETVRRTHPSHVIPSGTRNERCIRSESDYEPARGERAVVNRTVERGCVLQRSGQLSCRVRCSVNGSGHVISRRDGQNVGDGARGQTVYQRRGLSESMAGFLRSDCHNPREQWRGEARAANYSDTQLSV